MGERQITVEDGSKRVVMIRAIFLAFVQAVFILSVSHAHSLTSEPSQPASCTLCLEHPSVGILLSW